MSLTGGQILLAIWSFLLTCEAFSKGELQDGFFSVFCAYLLVTAIYLFELALFTWIVGELGIVLQRDLVLAVIMIIINLKERKN